MNDSRVNVGIVFDCMENSQKARDSGMTKIFNSCIVEYDISIIPARKDHQELIEYCSGISARGIKVLIVAASVSAGLPGDIAAGINFKRPVIAVWLPSRKIPIVHRVHPAAITKMTKKSPILFAGLGENGLKSAAITACQMLALNEDIRGTTTKEALYNYLAK